MSAYGVLTSVRLHTEIEQALFYLTYGSIVHGHKGLPSQVRNKVRYYRNRISEAVHPGKLYNRFVEVWMVNSIFRARMHSLIESEDCDVRTEVLERIGYCHPAGVTITGWNWNPCRYYLACPYCRYRKLKEVYDWLRFRLTEADHLAVIRLRTCADGVGAVPGRYEANCLNHIGRRLATRRDFAVCRVLMPAIHWEKTNRRVDDYHRWFLTFDVFALVREGTTLPRPKDDLNAVEEHSDAWRVFPASKEGLITAIRALGRYPAKLLYADTPPSSLSKIIQLQRNVRYVCSDHGLSSKLLLQKRYQSMEEEGK